MVYPNRLMHWRKSFNRENTSSVCESASSLVICLRAVIIVRWINLESIAGTRFAAREDEFDHHLATITFDIPTRDPGLSINALGSLRLT